MSVESKWASLTAREQRLVKAGIFVIVVAGLWIGTVMPSWREWREAPERLQAASVTWSRMQVMAAQAEQLRAGASSSLKTSTAATGAGAALRDQAAGLDEATAASLRKAAGGRASIQVQGGGLVLEFDSISPEVLREVLRTVRQRLKVQMVEVDIQNKESGLKGRLRLEWVG